MKYFKLLFILVLVFTCSDAFAQRTSPIKMSGATIEGTTPGSGSIMLVNPATLINGDTFVVDFRDDPVFQYYRFTYSFDTTSTAAHNSPWVLEPTISGGYGRWILVDASEWPCDTNASDCYMDLPINAGEVDAPLAGFLRVSATGTGIFSRIFGEDPKEIGTGGLPSGGLSGQVIIGSVWDYVDNAIVAYDPTVYSVSAPGAVEDHLTGIDASFSSLFSRISALEAAMDDANFTYSVVSVAPESWDYGSIMDGLTSDKNFIFTSTRPTDVVFGTFSLTGTDAVNFSITSDGCSSETLGLQESCVVTVQFSPDAVAEFSANLSAPSNAPDTPKVVALTGTGVASTPIATFESSPSSKDFGTITVGNTSNQGFTITNSGDATGTISSVALSGVNTGQFIISLDECEGESVLAAGACGVEIDYAPTETGAHSATLSIVSDSPSSPLEIALSGEGTDTSSLEVDAIATTSANNATMSSFPHTVGASANLLVVYVKTSSGNGLATGVTYNDVAMTNLWEPREEQQLYYLIDPPTGTNFVEVSWGTAITAGVIQSISFNNAHATSPLGTPSSLISVYGEQATISVPSAVGDFVIGFLSVSISSVTLDEGASLIQQGSYGTTYTYILGKAGGESSTSITASWSGNRWAHFKGVAIKPE